MLDPTVTSAKSGLAHCLHGLLAGEVFRKTEVDHFDAAGVIFASKHKVLRLDVSMTNILTVKVDQCGKQLVHDQSRFALTQVLSLDDKMEQFSSFAISKKRKVKSDMFLWRVEIFRIACDIFAQISSVLDLSLSYLAIRHTRLLMNCKLWTIQAMVVTIASR